MMGPGETLMSSSSGSQGDVLQEVQVSAVPVLLAEPEVHVVGMPLGMIWLPEIRSWLAHWPILPVRVGMAGSSVAELCCTG